MLALVLLQVLKKKLFVIEILTAFDGEGNGLFKQLSLSLELVLVAKYDSLFSIVYNISDFQLSDNRVLVRLNASDLQSDNPNLILGRSPPSPAKLIGSFLRGSIIVINK